MKKQRNILLVTMMAMLMNACHEQDTFETFGNEDIIISLSAGATRAEDTSAESYVDHIDIFIFEDEGGNPTIKAHHERQQVNNAAMLTLSAKRDVFDADKNYHVYLIANSTLNEESLNSINDYSDLLNTKQEDPMLYLTGLALDNVPKYFLMDAVAQDANGKQTVQLNSDNATDNTLLTATLRRAAAKVKVTINATDEVEFKDFAITDGSEGGLYYVRNLSYDAFLLAEAKDDVNIEAKVRTTSKGNSEYFTWQPETDNKKVSLIVYAYPNHWSNTSILEHETCIVMNLPMSYTANGTTTDYHNSWYKIPMTDDQTLRRNNYYEVNITLNRPGATSESTPIDVEEVHYGVEEWTTQTISVGNEDKPKYLMINQTELEMHNTDIDASTLEFASSSPVTISVKDIYYYNKYGIKTNEKVNITGTTDGNISGNIVVNSPKPDKNTIRYFTLVVTNQDGLAKEITVRQYPLVYITNIQSYYSYRSDFLNGKLGDGTATGDLYENRADYTRFGVNYSNGNHSYINDSREEEVFFRSKFVNKLHDSGLSDVDTYSQKSTSNLNNSYNARMYHIRITASSGDYILGRPKITDGVTDPGKDNARVVSPSFMIASQLGTVLASEISDANRKAVYTEHAKQYVEVYTDPKTGETVHLSDWRLPTAAELEIIYKYQGTSNDPANADAIDFLLGGNYYYSASGAVKNPKPSANSSGTFIRCIRDVY